MQYRNNNMKFLLLLLPLLFAASRAFAQTWRVNVTPGEVDTSAKGRIKRALKAGFKRTGQDTEFIFEGQNCPLHFVNGKLECSEGPCPDEKVLAVMPVSNRYKLQYFDRKVPESSKTKICAKMPGTAMKRGLKQFVFYQDGTTKTTKHAAIRVAKDATVTQMKAGEDADAGNGDGKEEGDDED